MTNNKKEEIIATMSTLLERLVSEDENSKASTPAITPDTVEMLTIKECCEAVKGLNEYTVRQIVARNAIPFVRAGRGKNGKVLIPKTALLEYLQGGNTN